MRKRDFEAEIGRFLEVYNAGLGAQLGLRAAGRDRGPLLREEPASRSSTRTGPGSPSATARCSARRCRCPTSTSAWQHMNGRLLPFGWAKFLWHRRKIDACRVFALGVKPEYQHLGIAAAFYVEHLEEADPEQKKIWWGEMGWILETNEPMNRAMEGMGGKIVQALPDLREGARAGRRRRGSGLGHGRRPGRIARRQTSRPRLYTGASCQPDPSHERGAQPRARARRTARCGPSSSRASWCWRCRCRAARWPSAAGGLTASAVAGQRRCGRCARRRQARLGRRGRKELRRTRGRHALVPGRRAPARPLARSHTGFHARSRGRAHRIEWLDIREAQSQYAAR